MSIRTRFALRWPIWALAVRKSHEAARLGAEVRALRQELAVVRTELAVAHDELDATKAHFDLACSQRDAARDFAAAIVSEREWNDGDEEWLRSLGERPA